MKIRRKVLKLASAAVVGYLLDPASGAQRRARLRGWVRQAAARWRPSPPPTDPVSLIELRDSFGRHGVQLVDHSINDKGDVVCGGCGQPNAPDTMVRVWRHRLEGATDPAEMLTVSGLRCGRCSSDGMLVLPFGPGADELEADVLHRLPPPATDHVGDVLAATGPFARRRAALKTALTNWTPTRR